MRSLNAQIEADLPRRVEGVEYNDPILTMFGEGWFLKLACPWAGSIAGAAVDWESPVVEDAAWNLIGMDLVLVECGAPGQVVFGFSDARLAVCPDTDEDPWVLSLPDFVVVGELR